MPIKVGQEFTEDLRCENCLYLSLLNNPVQIGLYENRL